MKLKLLWKSKEGKIFKLGTLEYANEQYVFKINKEELEKAIQSGCYGIGNFKLEKDIYMDTKLFDFFENRLPSQEKIEIIKKISKLENLDKMKMLEITKAKTFKDNYWVERDLS